MPQKWTLKLALFPAGKHAQRTSKYPANDGLNWSGITFPVKVSQIEKLEKQNRALAINVWGWENEDLIILHISKKPKEVKRIELMLLTNGEKSHYCWIKQFSRLLYSKTSHKGKHYYCERCLTRFSLESVLKNYQEYCIGVNGRPTRIDMPENGKNILQFENYQNQQKSPYVIYADFKSIIQEMVDPNRTEKMEKISKHVACGFAYMVVRSDGKSWSKKYRQGKDGNAPAAKEFLKAVQAEEVAIRKELETQSNIMMAPGDLKAFNESTNCWICEKSLIIPEY